MAEHIIELKHIRKCYVKDIPIIEDYNLKIDPVRERYRRSGRGKAGGHRVLRGGRQCPYHRRRSGVFPGHRGRNRSGAQQGARGGVHVRTRDPRGAGTGPDRTQRIRNFTAAKAALTWEGRNRPAITPHFNYGGALSWHRK